ncbi:hypothetical protein BV22DRAFT_1041915 [Leucogyrophana mollusca]|uniref:Uncharacterized protein n=1 Tax=Leucogyrophana mollusca TaxID=85980 RepID=A0ACB8AZB7_9AGAM|nr:hypothetical protein BV22DRAFT_1041915 [Leucogyrophana mollusca]
MQFKFTIVVLAAFVASACAAPFPEGAIARRDVVDDDWSPTSLASPDIRKRAVAITPDYTGDLANFVIPAGGSTKKEQAKVKKAEAKQAARVKLQATALASAQRLLNAAQSGLSLPDTLDVTFKNNFHPSPSESTSHITIAFSATACKGTCVAHGFEASNASPGDIFAADHSKIYPA